MKKILLGAATAVALLCPYGAANAAPLFEFSLNGGNVVSTSGTTLDEVNFSFSSGGYNYTIADMNAQYTQIVTPSGPSTVINFAGSGITRTGGIGTSTLTVALTLTEVPDIGTPTFSNHLGGNDANNSIVAYSSTHTAFYIDAGDTPFAATTLETSASPVTNTAGNFSYAVNNSLLGTNLAVPYSVTLLRILTFTNNGSIPANFAGISTIGFVPEPASLTLLGTGLLAAGFMFAFRRKSNAANA